MPVIWAAISSVARAVWLARFFTSPATTAKPKAAGVKIPRTSQAQYRSGKKVSKSALKPGDLVFFYSGITHVGIYAGNGDVIHASRPGKPIAKIKMKYMPYQGARRPG